MKSFLRLPRIARWCAGSATGVVCHLATVRSGLLLLTLGAAGSAAFADTFVYDAANRLQSATQSSGISYSYGTDEEANLLSIAYSATDTTGSGGAGNGIPDWWEIYYFGTSGIDPLASPANDGVSNLMKFALGQNPLTVTPSSVSSTSFQLFSDGHTYPYITYVRTIGAGSMLTLQQSSNGSTWLSGNSYFAPVTVTDLGNGTEQVVARSLTALPAASGLSFRLQASVSSPAIVAYYNMPPASAAVPAAKWWALVSVASLLIIVVSRLLRYRRANANSSTSTL